MKLKFKKQMVLTALLAGVSGSMNAQTQELSLYQFVEVQGGGLYMSTEGSSNQFSPVFGLSYGLMSPTVGGRLHLSGWEAKGGSYENWKYALADLDLLLNMTNLFSKSNSHPLNIFLVGGFGLASTWDREGKPTYAVDHSLSHSLRGGLRLETDITKALGLSLEVDANSMSHHFTGCASNSSNWGLTAQLGVSYRFGRKYVTPTVLPVKAENLTRYQMMLAQLNEQMLAWSKRMPNETLEEYQLRVNDETRAAQREKLCYEISTQMAETMLDPFEVTVGDYNAYLKKLAVHVSSMPDIFLDVAENEVASLYDNGSNLKLSNKKYVLNPDDSFEMVYAEATIPTLSNTYVFNNLKHESLAYISEDAHFVTAEVFRKSQMEETALVGIKDDITSLAKQENVISDKTHISVSANAEPAKGVNGNQILNYNVGFSYEVEPSFSMRDDFKPGRYKTNESKAAVLMLKVVKKAFDTDFAKYLAEGKRVKIKITGTADASPISHAIAYDGAYGEYENKTVYANKTKETVSLTKKDGISTNEQLAFARAIGVQHYLEKEIPALSKMKHDYEYYIEVAKEKGSEYRRINVQFIFEDAF